jgi:predicted MFS family arabinose efflux permease
MLLLLLSWQAPLQDIFGSHKVFLLGESLSIIGLLFALSKYSIPVISLGWLLFLSGASINNGAIQSIMSHSVEPSELSRTTSMLETGWAMASLVGLPLLGVVLKRSSWTVLFCGMLALHLIFASFVTFKFFGLIRSMKTQKQLDHQHDTSPVVDEVAPKSALDVLKATLNHFRETFANPRCQSVLIFGICLTANSTLNGAVFGQWLAYRYGFDSERVGLLSLCMGAGELTGAFFMSRLTARFGRKRVFTYGILCLFLAQLLLAAIESFSLWLGIISFYICATCSELTLICSITLVSSGAVSDHSIGTLVGLYFSTFNLGSMCAAFFVSPIFQFGGLPAVSLTGGSLVILSALVFRFVVQKNPTSSDSIPEDSESGSAAATPVPPQSITQAPSVEVHISAPVALMREDVYGVGGSFLVMDTSGNVSIQTQSELCAQNPTLPSYLVNQRV